MQEARTGTAGMADLSEGASIGRTAWQAVRSLTEARGTVLAVAVAFAYTLPARLSLLFILEPANIAGIWPPAGIAVGALLVSAPRRWPALLMGIAVAVWIANLSAGMPAGMTVGFVIANLAGPLLAAAGLRAFGFVRLTTVRDVGRFFAIAVLVAPAIGATIGTASAALGSGAPFFPTWLLWFLGDAGGVMAIAPLFLVPSTLRHPGAISWPRIGEAVLLAALLVEITVLAFFPITSGIHLAAYPVFLLVVIAGVRFGTAGAALATFAIAILTVAGTIAGSGPIAALNPDPGVRIGQAQVLIAVVFLASTLMATAMAERRAAADALAAQMEREAARASRYERVTAFAREIARSLDEAALFQHIVQAAADVVRADVIQLTVATPGTSSHAVAAAIGAPAVIGRVIESGDGITGSVIRDGVPMTLGHVALTDRAQTMQDVMPDMPMAITCAPIISDGAVVATLGMARFDLLHPFAPDEVRAIGMMCDLSALALTNSHEFGQVHERSIRDALTGVPNRRYFDLSLEQLSAQRIRQPDGSRLAVSIILFDLDHFGSVNKERGHATGDRVLAAFGEILASRLRRADIVARYGGEEFVAVLVGADQAGAQLVAEEVRTTFAQASVVGHDGAPIRCTVSAGVATIGPEEASIDGLIATADVALSMAKRAGRNQVTAA